VTVQNEMRWAGASLPCEDTTTCERSAPARTQILIPSKWWASNPSNGCFIFYGRFYPCEPPIQHLKTHFSDYKM